MQFAGTSLWLRLDPDQLAPLTANQSLMHLRHKQPIFYQGDIPQSVYVVKKGRVCITMLFAALSEGQFHHKILL